MIVYLDNILILTWILKDHYKVVCRILKVLAEHKLFLHPKKCKFNKPHIEYLYLVISEDQVEMDPVKVTRVHNWPVPTTCIDLQIFLSFTNFY